MEGESRRVVNVSAHVFTVKVKRLKIKIQWKKKKKKKETGISY